MRGWSVEDLPRVDLDLDGQGGERDAGFWRFGEDGRVRWEKRRGEREDLRGGWREREDARRWKRAM